ncbi:MAG: aldo/keto reductase [Gemmatimonadota bacterium]|nr:aldo/keto reductase [Gemmatimonadota bacterium]
MKTERLGRTGLEVPIVGLGTGFIGIADPNRAATEYDFMDGWDEDGPARSDEGVARSSNMEGELGVATVHAAIEAGSTLIDTAPLYGSGNSESIIGEALRQRPGLAERCTVTTKVGQTADGRDHSYDAVMRQVDESRQRLGIDAFDVLYIHDAMDIPIEEVMGKDRALGALRRLQDAGVTRFVGTATNDPHTNARYIETGEFDAAVVPEALSLINQLAGDRILPAAVRHDVGLVIATPVERGLLATGPVDGVNYLARSFSRTCLDHVAAIQDLCNGHGVPMVAAALQWCTRHPQVAATIPGARVPAEARANARAGDVDIPEAFWKELAPFIRHFEADVDR